jgi:phosphoglycolate phosphatase-like HAD superfamily hydrolase
MKPILLFDIDGTLLHVKKNFLYEIIHQILTEFEISDISLENRSFAGRTDKDIFSELIEEFSHTRDLYDSVSARYIKLMTDHLSAEYVEMIDGVRDAIDFARLQNIPIGLCTGNYREVAYAKVGAVGLNNVFSFGGFGCDHQDRNHLPGQASMEYTKKYKQPADSNQFIVIGDTPNDVRCARFFGAKAVAVTTGGFNKAQLRKHKPDLILDSLQSPQEWFFQLTKASQR